MCWFLGGYNAEYTCSPFWGRGRGHSLVERQLSNLQLKYNVVNCHDMGNRRTWRENRQGTICLDYKWMD